MKSRFDAIRRHLASHGASWRGAWQSRHDLVRPDRSADELAFLPAHLELIDTPVSPTARLTTRIIMVIFCVALAWSFLGEVDIVASAPGKTAATSRTKIIQPMETSVIRRVAVRDGDRVVAGQVVVELDEATNDAEWRQATEALSASSVAAHRYELLAAAIDHERLEGTEILDPKARTLAALDLEQFLSRKRALKGALAQRQREATTIRTQLPSLEASARIAKKRKDDTGKLVASRHVSEHEYLIREQEWLETDRNLSTQRTRLAELASAAEVAQNELQNHIATTRQYAADQLREASNSLAQYQQDVARTLKRKQQMALRAPVAGTVQQLAIHTVGGVVTPAQALLAIVPDNDPLEVEANVLNQDIGFVREGQRVTVKIESFPYTRYGYIEGEVISVSHDAAQDEKLGLIFPARIRLDRTSLPIDGVDVNLTAGMNVTAEVKTGKRRLIDYLIDPLRVHVSEAARER